MHTEGVVYRELSKLKNQTFMYWVDTNEFCVYICVYVWCPQWFVITGQFEPLNTVDQNLTPQTLIQPKKQLFLVWNDSFKPKNTLNLVFFGAN